MPQPATAPPRNHLSPGERGHFLLTAGAAVAFVAAVAWTAWQGYAEMAAGRSGHGLPSEIYALVVILPTFLLLLAALWHSRKLTEQA